MTVESLAKSCRVCVSQVSPITDLNTVFASKQGAGRRLISMARRGWARTLALALAFTVGVVCAPATASATSPVTFTGFSTQVGSGFAIPYDVVVDSHGNVFVADSNNNAVKEVVAVNGTVTATSTVNTVGSGFSNPLSVAVDASGDVFVADYGNNLVKEIVAVGGVVSSSSTVKTVGSGFNGPQGVAVDASGDVFVSDTGNNAVKEVVAVGGQVSSTSTVNTVGSGFSAPHGLRVDASGDVFVADYGHNAVKEIVAVSGAVSSASTVNTVGSGFSYLAGVALDAQGDVFVADYGNNSIKEIVAVSGQVSSTSAVNVIGSGFSSPHGVAVGASGNVYVADYGNNLVKEFTYINGSNVANLGSIFVCPGSQTTPAPCNNTGILYFNVSSSTTFGSSASDVVSTQGASGLDFTKVADTCAGNTISSGACTVTVKFAPVAPGLRRGGVQLKDGSGNVLVTAQIQGVGQGPAAAFAPAMQTALTVSVAATGLNFPVGAAVDAAGNLFIADANHNRVVKIPAGGGSQVAIGTGLNFPNGVAVDGAGDVFVANTSGNNIQEIPAGGSQFTFASGLSQPGALAVDGAGDLFVVDVGNNRVLEYPANGSSSVTVYTETGSYIGSIAVDAAGNLFIADYVISGQPQGRVVKVTPAGVQTTLSATVGGVALATPYGVAVDAAGDLFIADSYNKQVVELPAGGASPFAIGSGFSDPTGLAVDAAGNIFIVDTTGNSVAKISGSAPAPLNFTSNVNVASAAQSFTIQNIGNQPLSAVSPGLGYSVGTNFIKVSGSGTPADCTTSFSLSAGSLCNVSLEFDPQAVGPILADGFVFTDNALNTSPSATQTVSVSGTVANPQTITVTSVPTSQAYGSTFTVSATGGGSGNALVYTSAGGCTNSGSSYTMTSSTLTCSVIIDQSGNATYGAAPEVTKSVSATLANQYITVTTAPPTGAQAYNTSFTLVASSTYGSTSGGAATGLSLTYASSGGCVNTGAVYAMSSPTTSCSITISQAGNGNYNAATPVTYTVTATKATPVVGVSVTGCTYNGSACATVNSTITDTNGANIGGVTATLSYVGIVSTVYGPTATAPINAGTYTVTASWAGNTNYTNANSLAESFTISPASQAITVTTGAPVSEVYNGQFTVVAAGGASGNALVFGSSGVCSNTGATYTMTSGTGTCTVTINQSGAGSNYTAAPTITSTVNATKASQTISVLGPTSITYGSTGTAMSTGSSGTGSISFSVSGSGCSLSGTTISVLDATQSCTLTANINADNNYSGASSGPATVTLNKAGTITQVNCSSVTYTGSSLSPCSATVTDGSGMTTLVSNGTPTYSNGTTNATTGSASYTYGGSNNYASSTNSATYTIGKAGTSTSINNCAYYQGFGSSYNGTSYVYTGSAQDLINCTATTTGVNGFSTNPSVTFQNDIGAGSGSSSGGPTATATFGGNQNYASSTATQYYTIGKASGSISFSASTPVTYGIAPYTLTATGDGSSSPVVFSIASGPGSVSGTNGSTLTVTSASPNTITIYANQAADSNYYAASQVSQTVTVNQNTPTVNLYVDANPVQAPNPITLTAVVAGSVVNANGVNGTPKLLPTGTVNFLQNGTVIGSGTLINGVATLTTTLGVGTEPLTANYLGDSNFNACAGCSVPITEVVNNLLPNIGGGSLFNFGSLAVGSNETLPITVSFPTALTLSSLSTIGDFQLQGGGTCAIPATLSAGQSCEFYVKFSPTQPGQRWFPMVATDSNGNKYSFGLEGTGVGPALAIAPGIISAYAGNGTAGLTGNGAAATLSELSNPASAAVDAQGNLYIADTANNVIRKVSASTGFISILAGSSTGVSGYTGDGGLATAAKLNKPAGVALDSANNLYIADTGNNLIRMVDVNGNISTVAGNSAVGGTYAGDGNAAIAAGLNQPQGVAVDGSGNIYIADTLNNVIRKVSGGIISTVAGNGTNGYNGDNIQATNAQLYNPTSVAIDVRGNLYIADSYNNRVREVSTNGTITTLAGNGIQGYSGDGGLAASAQLSNPTGVAVDNSENVYVADSVNNRIRKVLGGNISTIAGNGTSGATGNNGAATAANLNLPTGVVVDGYGDIFIADSGNNAVRVVGVYTSYALAFASSEVGNFSTDSPQSVQVVNVGNQLLKASGTGLAITGLGEPSFIQVAGSGTPVDCTTSFSLTPGSSCNLSLGFKPTTYGALQATQVLTDNSLNVTGATQSISLSGTGYSVPVIITQPVGTTVNMGNTASFSVAATGTPTLTYTWQFSSNSGSSWINWGSGTGMNAAAFTTPATNHYYNGILVRVIVADGNGLTTTSNAVTLTVQSPPVITSPPTSQTVTVGTTASFSVTATGTPTLTYVWQYSVNNGVTWTNWTTGTGYNAATFVTPATTAPYNGALVRVIVTDGNSLTTTSTPVLLTVQTPPQITSQPAAAVVNYGSTATFSVTATTGSPALSYAWQFSTNSGSTWTNWSGGAGYNAATFTTPATNQYYNGILVRVIVKDGNGVATTSNTAPLTVTSPIITTAPTAATVYLGSTATFSVTAVGAPNLSYAWQFSTNGGTTWVNWGAGTGYNTASFTTPATNNYYNGIKVRVIVTDGNGHTATSSGVSLTVNSSPTITQQPLSQNVSLGNTASFSVTATGAPTITYVWQFSTNGGTTWVNWGVGTGYNTASFTTPATNAYYNGIKVRVVVSDGNGNSLNSNAVTLTN